MMLAKALVFAALVCIAGVLLRNVGAFQLKGVVASLSEWTEVVSVSAEKPRGSDACQAETRCKGRDTAQGNEGSLFTSIKERIQRKLKALKSSKAGPDELVFLQKTIIPKMREGVLAVRRVVKSYDREKVAQYVRHSIEEAIQSVKEAVEWCKDNDIPYLTMMLLWCIGQHFLRVWIVHRYFLDD